MPRQNVALYAFNRGRISPLALARTDLARTALSAERSVNFIPRALGSMALRAGLGFTGSTRNDAAAVTIPFVFSVADTASIEVTADSLRVWVDDELVTRAAVSTAVTNGTFDSDLTGWTDVDESGATSAFETGGYMSLVGTGTLYAKRRQQVSVNGADIGVRHALRVVVQKGVVRFRVGSSAGDDDFFAEALLGPGTHSCAFTPTGTFHIELAAQRLFATLVDSVTVESSGTMELPSPWPESSLEFLRWRQSLDVVYVADGVLQQRKVERRDVDSWSIVLFAPEDGPFNVLNVSPTTLAPSALSGTVTLTASAALFTADHVGALFKIASGSQFVTETLDSDDDFFVDNIRVTGVGGFREMTIIITGVVDSTVTLQRSVDAPGSWIDVETYTTNQSKSFNDGFDNQVIFYRLGIKSGNYGTDTVVGQLVFQLGSISGVGRVTAVANATSATVDVLKAFGSTAASQDWQEGSWSTYKGYPSAVELFDGRLMWAGSGGLWASVSDAYESYDEDVEGDSGPISRTLGFSGADNVSWMVAGQRLLVGTSSSEIVVRSSVIDEPLTPTAFNAKQASTQGSAQTPPVQVDNLAIFVHRSGQRVMELSLEAGTSDSPAKDITVHIPEVGEPSILRLAVQRQPDTRVHCVRSDGTVAVMVIDRAEDVLCWVDVETDGVVEDAFVLPGLAEDQVYYQVARTVGGQTKRYREKFAMDSKSRGAADSRISDSHIVYSGASTATITGLDHLEGRTVVAWGNSKDLGTYTVSSGSVTLSEAVTFAVVGLGYTAQWLSTKLAYAAGGGTGLLQRKAVPAIGVILRDTHKAGLKYGPSFSLLDDLPAVEDGAVTDDDVVWDAFDKDMFAFPGQWDTDSRVALQAQAPRACTLLALVAEVVTNG